MATLNERHAHLRELIHQALGSILAGPFRPPRPRSGDKPSFGLHPPLRQPCPPRARKHGRLR